MVEAPESSTGQNDARLPNRLLKSYLRCRCIVESDLGMLIYSV